MSVKLFCQFTIYSTKQRLCILLQRRENKIFFAELFSALELFTFRQNFDNGGQQTNRFNTVLGTLILSYLDLHNLTFVENVL